MKEDEKKEEETVESQKLSKRDKQELQEGLCVNCAIFFFVIMIIGLMVFLV